MRVRHLSKQERVRIAYHLEELFKDAAADLGLTNIWIEWSNNRDYHIAEIELKYNTGYRRRINGKDRSLTEIIADVARAI